MRNKCLLGLGLVFVISLTSMVAFAFSFTGTPADEVDETEMIVRAVVSEEADAMPTMEPITTTGQEQEMVKNEQSKIGSMDWDSDDAYRLAKIAMAEAESEDTEGKALVMLVVLNRVWDDEFPDTIEEVIFQKGQFSPISNGRYDEVEPDEDCYRALQLIQTGGWDESHGATYFESKSVSTWHSENLTFLFKHCCMLDLPDDVPIKRISFGVDVARYGSDETVIAKNVGGRITLPVSFRGQSLMTTVGKIVQLYRQAITEFPRYRGKIYINIDDCGLGGGVTDRLEEVKQEEKLTRMVIVPVNAAGKVPEETLGDGKQKACDIYDNMTTYLWGTVKDALMMEEVSLENDNELVAQFTCRKYRLTSRGKMLLESKEEMKKRGIDSPDRADAVALSCYQKKTFNIGSLVD